MRTSPDMWTTAPAVLPDCCPGHVHLVHPAAAVPARHMWRVALETAGSGVWRQTTAGNHLDNSVTKHTEEDKGSICSNSSWYKQTERGCFTVMRRVHPNVCAAAQSVQAVAWKLFSGR